MASSPLHPSRELQPLPLPRFHRSTHPHLVPRAPPGSDVSEVVGIVGLLIALGQIVKSLVWSGKGIELRGSEELGDLKGSHRSIEHGTEHGRTEVGLIMSKDHVVGSL